MGQWFKVRTLIQAPKKKERNKDNGGMYGSVSLEGCLGALANLKLNLCLLFFYFIYVYCGLDILLYIQNRIIITIWVLAKERNKSFEC